MVGTGDQRAGSSDVRVLQGEMMSCLLPVAVGEVEMMILVLSHGSAFACLSI